MKNIFDLLFVRDKHVCPWWCCFTFDNPLRALLQDPFSILSPYMKPGDTAIDIGPGMGYYTIPLCKIAGEKGRVIAVDIQQKMLDGIKKRAIRAGAPDNLTLHISEPEDFKLVEDKADFVLMFWMLHEVPNQEQFLRSAKKLMKPGARLLIAEPYLHVTKKKFRNSISIAEKLGFAVAEQPKIGFSHAVVLKNI